MKKYSKILICLLFSAAGLAYILLVTGINNLGASPDSVSYLKVSQNIFNGNGLAYYSNGRYAQWPPLYPAVLFFSSSVLGIDSINASKFLSAFLLFAAIFISNLLFIKFKAQNLTLIILNLLLLMSPAFSVYLMIWSEPLFIFLLLLICYFFIRWIESNKIFILLLVSFLSALLIMTRFAGIGFAAGIIIFLLLKKDTIKVKLVNLILYSLIVFGIFTGWQIFLSNITPDPVKREVIFHMISTGHLRQMAATIMSWMNPSLPLIGVIFFLILLVLIFIDLWKRNVNFRQIINDDPLRKFLLLLIISYIGFLIFSISFIDFHIYLENRILAPVFPLILILMVPLLNELENLNSRKYLYYALLIFLIVSYGYNFIIRSSDFYFKGEGYTNRTWLESKTIESLKNYRDVSIFTNGQDVLQLLYSPGNPVYILPRVYSPSTQLENPDFKEDMQAMKDSLGNSKVILVYFNNFEWRKYYPGKDYLKKELNNLEFEEFKDGFILHK